MSDKYSLNDAIHQTIIFNKDRGLLSQKANSLRRLSFTLEEEIERFGLKNDKLLSKIEAYRRLNQWEDWKEKNFSGEGVIDQDSFDAAVEKHTHQLSEKAKDEELYLEKELDSSVDKIIYEIGEMAKTINQSLKLDENKAITEEAKLELIESIICQAFNSVVHANKRKGQDTNELGQIEKGFDFKPPKVINDGIVDFYWGQIDNEK